MEADVLVIGGNLAGLEAATDLGAAGLRVELIERAPFLSQDGGPLRRHELRQRQLELLKHPLVRTRTNTALKAIQPRAGGFEVTLAHHPRFVDLERCTACGECLRACPVTLPGTQRKAIYLEGQPGCAAIEKAGVAPCAHTCPAGIHVQGYVALIAQGRYREAIDLIHEAMPFPSVCGRVCNHYCEAECTRGKVDAPVNIMALKRFVADWEYARQPAPRMAAPPVPSGRHVAVIGAGPAGLTAARGLHRMGHRVTVFDALPVAGGMMRVGIPAHRLPEAVLEWEIQRIVDEGVTLRLETRIDDVPGLLRSGYDAVLIATGAHRARKLQIPNADHPDNWLSLDLLRRVALGERVDLRGRQVVVLGGGNVALDTARTALRLGAGEVCMACLEPRGEMPGFAWEVQVAEEEGIQVCPGRAFTEILLEGGRVAGVRCEKVVFRGFEDGRPDFDAIPGSGHVLPADLVVWAIGQAADLSFLPEDGSIRPRQPSGIWSDAGMMTSLPGVFVAGDVHRGVTFFVVDAIGEGHRVAASIDRYLRGERVQAKAPGPKKVRYSRKGIASRLEQVSRQERVAISSLPVAERAGNFEEVDLTLTEEQARAEAGRCLVCGPCSQCLACVQACPVGAISHDQRETRTGLQVSAVLCADEGEAAALSGVRDRKRVLVVAAGDPLRASAAAGETLASLARLPRREARPAAQPHAPAGDRLGVFLCACGGEISTVVDLRRARRKLHALPQVVYSQELPFSCTPEAAATIRQAIADHRLDGVVLASCACCAQDQACYSCTYQRVRSRRNLGAIPGTDAAAGATKAIAYAFVNLREQCAWVHAGFPRQATEKAIALTRAAVAGLANRPGLQASPETEPPSILALGRGPALARARMCFKALGIPFERAGGLPERIARTGGRYLAEGRGRAWSASALILAPRDSGEAGRLLGAFEGEGVQPRQLADRGGVDTHRPGVFYCDPRLDPGLAGWAVAARAAAWLGRREAGGHAVAAVDPARCRGCGTCEKVCEFGAVALHDGPPAIVARVDPEICRGCGMCSAHCPSGAIRMGGGVGAGVETELAALFQENG